MPDLHSHDVIILGSGLAGLRAAVQIARTLRDNVDMAIVSKLQVMRSHSVCAEGGTAAVLRPEEGDSFDLHAWDTIKGSDFLADQDVVDLFVRKCPEEIRHLDHWGLPWSRNESGQIHQRPFGGHSYPRATMAADKTGFFEMQCLYDTLLKYNECSLYHEVFITKLLVEENRFVGLCGYDKVNGKFVAFRGKALLIATGGMGTLYGFTTYSQTVTGDGHAIAYKAGLPLEDPEFLQFHPTGLVPSGILMTEGCRGEGGHLKDKDGNRFMARYAASKMELAPRDIVSRAEMTEIEEGRGFLGKEGLDYVHLDLTHLGAKKINHRLPLVREVCIKFNGIDPIKEPIPVRAVAHYSMGGIETDINGKTRMEGIWVAGEAMCSSLHGANRLGTNSTAECLVWGAITGNQIAEHLSRDVSMPTLSQDTLEAERRRVFDVLMGGDGNENPYEIKRDLRKTMDFYMGVFRTADKMKEGLEKIHALKKRYERVSVKDRGMTYNTNLADALEIDNMLLLAEVMVVAALAREESRGGHARNDFPKRDDDKWLKHTLVTQDDSGPVLDYKPVTITKWKPVERKY